MREEVDLDMLVHDFIGFVKVVDATVHENDQIKEQLKISDQRIYTHTHTEKQSQEEISKLKQLISSYEKMLYEFNNMKEEMMSLKKDITGVNEENRKLKKEIVLNKEQHVQDIEALEEYHRKELVKTQQQVHDIAESEIAVYSVKLQQAHKEIEVCKQKLNEKEKQFHLDMAKTKLEYDAKIHKLQQKQLSQANNSAGSASARNDIFRKKMQHLQLQTEKELKVLRAQNTEQQQEIAEQQHQLQLRNKSFQERLKKEEETIRQKEKLLRQSQLEIRRLQSMLKHEKENGAKFENEAACLKKLLEEQQACVPKRKKNMFNPNNNRLAGPM